MIPQYVYIFFLVYTTVQIIKLAVGGEAAMYFICSHAIPPPSLPLALRRHPDASSIAAVGNKEWRSLARVLSLAFSYSVKASLLSEPLVASNSILLEQSVCEQNNLIPLFSTTRRERKYSPLRTYSFNRCQQTSLHWNYSQKRGCENTIMLFCIYSFSIISWLNWLKFRH